MPDDRVTRDARQRAAVDTNSRRQREPSKRRPPAHLKPLVELYGEPGKALDDTSQASSCVASASGILPDDCRHAVRPALEQLEADERRPVSVVRNLEPKREGQAVELEAGRIGMPTRQERRR